MDFHNAFVCGVRTDHKITILLLAQTSTARYIVECVKKFSTENEAVAHLILETQPFCHTVYWCIYMQQNCMWYYDTEYMVSWKLFSTDNSTVKMHHGNKAQPWNYLVII